MGTRPITPGFGASLSKPIRAGSLYATALPQPRTTGAAGSVYKRTRASTDFDRETLSKLPANFRPIRVIHPLTAFANYGCCSGPVSERVGAWESERVGA